jgi:hypothetical protein
MVKTPPPGQMNPGVSQQFQGMLQTQGPQYGQTLGEAMKTGMPTDVAPAFQAMLAARQKGMQQGAGNIVEAYGASGNRYGSSLPNALVDYQLQSDKDFNSTLANYSMQASENAAMRMMQALGLFGGQYSESANTTYPTAALVTGPSLLSQLTGAGQAAAMTYLASQTGQKP